MQRASFLSIIVETFVIVVVTFVLGGSAAAQVTYKTLYNFRGGADGSSPQAVVRDSAGNLYGTTFAGGANGYGSVFELSPNADGTWSKQTLHSFANTDGNEPGGTLIFDPAGNLYGITLYGGGTGGCYFTGDCGVVFKLTHNSDGSWTESVLHVFTGEGGDGANPQGALTFDNAGNLYGTTAWGGGGMGSVFQLTPNSNGSWTEYMLYGFAFDGATGAYPNGTKPVFDAAGNLYGTTTFGGLSGCSPRGNGCYGLGVVFELTPNSTAPWNVHVLHSFTDGRDGASPTCPLILDTAGNVYGTASWGGSYSGNGTVFMLTPNADGHWTERVLHEFTGGKDGGVPFAGLVFDSAGNLYGATLNGGNLSDCDAAGCGVVYELTRTSAGGWGETVLHTFENNPGSHPSNSLIIDAAGHLYGTTNGDGVTTFGSVFEITP
jgi:uncharacterized repeat protein (TIGR03803 family)